MAIPGSWVYWLYRIRKSTAIEEAGVEVTLSTSIREVFSSNLGRDAGYHAVFRCFPQSLQADARTVHRTPTKRKKIGLLTQAIQIDLINSAD